MKVQCGPIRWPSSHTRDSSRRIRFAESLVAGMVSVDAGLVSTAQALFGGVKSSGLGREGSRYGLYDYTSLKYIATRISASSRHLPTGSRPRRVGVRTASRGHMAQKRARSDP